MTSIDAPSDATTWTPERAVLAVLALLVVATVVVAVAGWSGISALGVGLFWGALR